MTQETTTTAVTRLPQGARPKTHEIIAAQKIIADISSGVYRSPAAAIKELISNAYDADATRVSISTDAPSFRTLTVSDNGSGMDIDKFLDVMNHIGGSRKRIGSDVSPLKKRKIIGRIGIGMLSVAQLGTKFYVSSTQKGQPHRFIAEVNLEPFHKDDAALVSMTKQKGDDHVHIGAIKYVDQIPEDTDLHYTVITVPDAKKGLTSEITGLVRRAVGATEILNATQSKISSFREIVDVVRSSNRADLVLDGYYYMIWELGLLSPVSYLDNAPFDPSVRTIVDLDSLKLPPPEEFSVTVDGIDIARPQSFPNPVAVGYPSPDPKLYALAYDRTISDRPLRFTGYIYSQQPRIQPEELKGIHIRIRGVGIGNYDKSWLGYPFDEGQKFGQVSGEIFVQDGLEPALNIDRDSFRETDVHYQALRGFVWDTLRKRVFPEFKLRQKEFRVSLQARARASFEARFLKTLDELPAPLTDEVAFEQHPKESLLQVLKGSKAGLRIEEAAWERLVAETSMNKEAQDRLIRILNVLMSSELLTDMREEEFGPLLQALAIAVQ
jgi:hypothetical protein